MKPTNMMVPNPTGCLAATVDAHAAADAASRLAAEMSEWSQRSGFGAEDAADAVACAIRARVAATHAGACTQATDAWSCARLAWAAVSSALEASARLNAALAEAFAAL